MTVDPEMSSGAGATNVAAPSPDGGESGDPESAQAPGAGAYRGWLAVTTMACGVVLGVVLGTSFGIGSDIRAGNGLLFAQGSLAQALSDELSGNHGIGPSFWSKDGYFCRVFDLRKVQRQGLDGIACRERAGWRIRIVMTAAGPAAMPASVRSTMDNLMVGSPLDAAAEQQARRQGWRPG